MLIVSLKSSFLSSENKPFPGVTLAPQCEVKKKKKKSVSHSRQTSDFAAILDQTMHATKCRKKKYSPHRKKRNKTILECASPSFSTLKEKKKDLVTHCIESSSHFGQLKKRKITTTSTTTLTMTTSTK